MTSGPVEIAPILHVIRRLTESSSSEGDRAPGDWVALQCDSTVFIIQTANIAATAPGSLLDTLFSDRSPVGSDLRQQLSRNTSHPLLPFVFDRSATYVAPLIEFLRTGELIIDANISRRGVLLEAMYFGVMPVVEMLRDVGTEFDPPLVPVVNETKAAVGGQEASLTTPSSVTTTTTTTTTAGVTAPRLPHMAMTATSAVRRERSCCSREEIVRSLRTLPTDVGLRLRGLVLNAVCFARLDLRNTNFELCSLLECDFTDCDLSRCCFSRAQATGSNFSRAAMTHAICMDAVFELCVFEGAQCTDSNFSGSNLRRARLSQCDFSRSVLIRCDLSHADLRGTVLHQTQMRMVKLEGVERSGTSISMGGVIA